MKKHTQKVIATFSSRGLCLAGLLAAGSIGCNLQSSTPSELLSKLKLPGQLNDDGRKIGPTKVLTDATALALELPESDLQACDKFRQRFVKLIKEDRLAAADILVARHPDHAHQVLTNQFDRKDKNLTALAASYDRHCGGSSGWHPVYSGASAESVDQYFFVRSQWLGAIVNGEFDSTETIDLVSAASRTGSEALVVDAWYQTGVAAMLRQQNSIAASAFDQAAELASDRQGTQAASALLLASESLRRAGDYAAATQSWQDAVVTACRLMQRRNIAEISFWERAAYLQPIGTSWPAEVASSLAHVGNSNASAIRTDLLRQLGMFHGDSLSPACWVEAAMGSWREGRGENQKAIVHLKKAESLAADHQQAKDWLRINQAPLLVSVGQQGTATTLLAPIVSREDDSPVMLAAMSKLGVIKLKGGSAQHGVRLLHHAVVESDAVDWPGKASARADLALGLLMIGEDAEGKVQLQQAQTRFKSEGEIEQLAKSLYNQKHYLEHHEAAKSEIAAVEERLKIMQL